MSPATLLICTVGGTAEAVAAAVISCQPDRVIFVVSKETHLQVAEGILPMAVKKGIALSPGQYELWETPDAQDFAGCVERMRELDAEVARWLKRGADYEVIVDFTGGTKCMSAALALVAHRWSCCFSYVGGEVRNKGGVGVVVAGRELVLHAQNPWDSLGYQAAEEALGLFNMGDYRGAIQVLDMSLRKVARADLKGELSSLRLLAEGYLNWDLFDHKAALQRLTDVQKNANNLRHLLPESAQELLQTVESNLAFLKELCGKAPGQHWVLDLCANARRCSERGRYDDAVARLYRAIEALAQLCLHEKYGASEMGKILLVKVPEPLRSWWSPRAKDGILMLGLQDDYQLLEALGDKLGQLFTQLGLDSEESPLTARNQSILAHGFAPVGESVFKQLWQKALALAEIKEEELPEFPRVGFG